ncbi:hypothetical protein EWM64_g2904 [Hericium alpestre]|uniref:ferroxidase n=1 Tax=Hericium alpestre TaxID=135208 RepID=A0A4Z0A3S7_9AGAM|nr:hypothetical protein EWM64_g2904 [Hericium alpestre]
MLPRNIARVALKRSIVQARHVPIRHISARHAPSVMLAQRRHFATPPPQVKHSDLDVDEYHALSDATMDTMLESLETLLDELGDPQYEVEYHSGVLTLKLGNHGTYVINKQPPNKQIWLSSPFSGPKRYDYAVESDDWYYARDGHSMGDLLNTELSQVLKQDVDLGLRDISKQVA